MKAKLKEVFDKAEQWIGNDPIRGARKCQVLRLHGKDGNWMMVAVHGCYGQQMTGPEVTEAIAEVLNEHLANTSPHGRAVARTVQAGLADESKGA